MKKLVATAPREAKLVEYEDRPIASDEVKVKVEFAAPKHGTELADFRGTTPFIDGKFDDEWRMFVQRLTPMKKKNIWQKRKMKYIAGYYHR